MLTEKLSIHGQELIHWDFQRIGLKGFGKNHIPILNMDKYINTELNDVLHSECLTGLTLCEDIKMGRFNGAVPPFEIANRGKNGWTQLLKDIEKYDTDGIHKKNLKTVIDNSSAGKRAQMLYRYMYFAMGAQIPWFFTLYLLDNSFVNKHNASDQYRDYALTYFPNVIEYIKTLPFKNIGRILFFTTYPQAGVVTHRDGPMKPHKDHNINLFFGQLRTSFVWDDINEEKIYLESNASSYFFNNRDYHGVDKEQGFKYTLRVDGTFTDEMCDELGLVDGWTWHPDYD